MSTPRKLGVFLCLLGFLAVCVLALTLDTNRYFAGLNGIQSGLETEAESVMEANGLDTDVAVAADGRDLSVALPAVVPATFDRASLENQLKSIEGVRSVELTGQPTIAIAADDAPAPQATVAPTPEPDPDPTPEPEPTREPTPEPAAPSLAELVAEIDVSDVNFEPGTARFTAQDTAVLDGIADQLQGLSGGPIQVQAHTNDVGDPDVNLLLSQDRAAAVVTYLIDRGVDASLLTSRGFGAQEPIADNSTEQGREANERVVLVVEGN